MPLIENQANVCGTQGSVIRWCDAFAVVACCFAGSTIKDDRADTFLGTTIMGKVTKISWCDSTFSPWIGCTEVSPGCDNCYSRELSKRYGWAKWGIGQPRYRTSASNWAQPIAWNRAAEKSGRVWRVFCAPLADVFDNDVPFQWRIDLWRLIEATPNLSWLLVTKRIGNVERMVPHHWLHNGFPS